MATLNPKGGTNALTHCTGSQYWRRRWSCRALWGRVKLNQRRSPPLRRNQPPALWSEAL